MQVQHRLLVALGAALLLFTACDERTTSLVAEISLADGEPAARSLSARVYGRAGALGPIQEVRAAALPGRLVVLLPARDDEVRVVVSATLETGEVARGAARRSIRRDAQEPLAIVLARATPDGDGDGVPDAVDDCPFTPDPEQANSAGDGPGDACRDRDLAAGADDLSAARDLSAPADLAPSVVLGTDQIGDHADPSPGGVAAAYPFVAARTTTVRRIFVYVDVAATAPTGTVGIYAGRVDASVGPGPLLSSGTGPLTKSAWTEIAIPPVALTAGVTYYLAMHNPNSGTVFTFRNVCATSREEYVMWGPLPTLPATWTDDSLYECSDFSAYASE